MDLSFFHYNSKLTKYEPRAFGSPELNTEKLIPLTG